ncbi:MAG: hypothetical protein A2Y38_07915 [Spirochaetes bacterium GWB1_59_5]|nr:MAG: hypothetical protein A2Y38_07915 [Spirochaetes bacterium GWB1_59_5]
MTIVNADHDQVCYTALMREASLNAADAAAFIARLGEHLEYNINIMDREGVIIASRDASRVGSYHDAARRLISSGASVERVDDGPQLTPGVRPGVNLPIVYKSETVGVVGVTGNPDAVAALAYAIKTSVESMIELEAWKEKALKRQDSKNLLQNLLLYDDDAPRLTMEALSRKLGYDPCVPRAPVIIAPPADLDPADALAAVKKKGAHGPQDMSFLTSEGTILVFKSVCFGGEGFIERFEAGIREYLKVARASIRSPIPVAAWIGAFQTDLGMYRGAYRQALWLSERFPDPGSEPLFLFDHLLEFMSSRIPRSELFAALGSSLSLFPAGLIGELGSSIEALADCALNGKEAAARLGVHRNTLSARMDRVARLLGRDPRRDPMALDFMRLLIRYAQLQGSDSRRASSA